MKRKKNTSGKKKLYIWLQPEEENICIKMYIIIVIIHIKKQHRERERIERESRENIYRKRE